MIRTVLSRSRPAGALVGAAIAGLALLDCSAGGGASDRSTDGSSTGGRGQAGSGEPDSGVTIDVGSGPSTGKKDITLAACDAQEECPEGLQCKYGRCLPNLGPCTTNDDCPGDSYCDPEHICVPYGVPESVTNDPDCKRLEQADSVQPVKQCEWSGPPASDPTSEYIKVYTAPIVADLNVDEDANRLQPSIVVTTWAEPPGTDRLGILRVFDGRSCEEVMRWPEGAPADPPTTQERPAYAAQLAIGDLDGDVTGDGGGHPEIVGLLRPANGTYRGNFTVAAWEVDTSGSEPSLKLRWKGRNCQDDQPVLWGDSWASYGPGLWDLNDDGSPEVVVGNQVFDAQGCLLNPTDAPEPLYIGKGAMSTVADVDLDGELELVTGNGWFNWSGDKWTVGRAFTGGAAKQGHVAVVDMGQYSTLDGRPATDPLPEIIVVSAAAGWNPDSTGSVRVVTLTGDVVFGPKPIPHRGCGDCYGGHGGPPTASDFDGDGQVEFAAAANDFYTVYDPDCLPGGTPAQRPGGSCQRDGNPLPPDAGVMREGVLWAVASDDYSSSQTGSSIFDFDGDGKSEAVYRDEEFLRVYDGATGSVIFSSPAESQTGTELPTVADVDGDFSTEIVVPRNTGFVVLRDPEDLWVTSRPIWNQHTYSVTHVTDDGRIPRSSEVAINWTVEGLNNFRQNTQGEIGAVQIADLTVELAELEEICANKPGPKDLSAAVCNRGTNPVQDGAKVAFLGRKGGSSGDTLLCETATQTLLQPGDCTEVACQAELGSDIDVFVVVDPDEEIADCHPGNNDGAGSPLLCPTIH